VTECLCPKALSAFGRFLVPSNTLLPIIFFFGETFLKSFSHIKHPRSAQKRIEKVGTIQALDLADLPTIFLSLVAHVASSWSRFDQAREALSVSARPEAGLWYRRCWLCYWNFCRRWGEEFELIFETKGTYVHIQTYLPVLTVNTAIFSCLIKLLHLA
jgi:hypothetical protein